MDIILIYKKQKEIDVNIDLFNTLFQMDVATLQCTALTESDRREVSDAMDGVYETFGKIESSRAPEGSADIIKEAAIRNVEHWTQATITQLQAVRKLVNGILKAKSALL